jgi:hypothetical protein
MADLTSYKVKDTYADLLTIFNGTINEGITGSAKRIFDGDGTGSPLWMSTNTLQIDGVLNLKEQNSQPSNPTNGDLAFISGELYIAK